MMSDKTYTPKEFAAKISGFEYPARELHTFSKDAKASNLLVAYGLSDDLLELFGIYNDEVDACSGTTIKIGSAGIKLSAIWCPSEYPGTSWEVRPECEFEPFHIMEDGEIFCVGAVIHKDSIEIDSEGSELERLRSQVAELVQERDRLRFNGVRASAILETVAALTDSTLVRKDLEAAIKLLEES